MTGSFCLSEPNRVVVAKSKIGKFLIKLHLNVSTIGRHVELLINGK